MAKAGKRRADQANGSTSNKKARKSQPEVSYDPQYQSFGEEGEGYGDSEASDGFEDLEDAEVQDQKMNSGGSGEEDDEDGYEDSDMEGGFEDLEAGEADGDHIEMSGEEDAEEQAEEAEQRKKHVSSLYSIPTNGEMQALRSTGELFKNNVLKLQIEELLSEIRPSYEKAGALELVLRRVHTLFNSLPTIEPRPLKEALGAMHKSFPASSNGKVRPPFAEPSPLGSGSNAYSSLKFGFAPPSALHLVGSWARKSATKRPDGLDVDLAVVMPSALFQEKDHMNLRYCHKRAFYLTVLAAALQEALTPSSKAGAVNGKKGKEKQAQETEAQKAQVSLHSLSLGWELLDDDPRRPVLVLQPVHDKSEMDFSKLKARIRIHPAFDPASIPFNFGRLAPNRNGIRVHVATSSTSAGEKDEGGSAESEGLPPTPLYNTTVLLDALQLAHLVYLHKTAQACPSFQDAAALVKTWAFQRGFGSGNRKKSKKLAASGGGAINDSRPMLVGTGGARFLLEMILAHLLRGEAKGKAKLSNGLSSYQLLKGVIDFLAKNDFASQPHPTAMKHIEGIPSFHEKIPAESFASTFEKVLIDPTGAINLLAFMPAGNVDKLRLEAQRTLNLLNDQQADHFDAIFLSDLSAPVLTSDEVMQISADAQPLLVKATKANGAEDASREAAMLQANSGSKLTAFSHKATTNIRKGLRDRATVVACFVASSDEHVGSTSLEQQPISHASFDLSSLSFGISYNIQTALRMVDHGPSPNDAEAAADYREFWGEMAELRRFKDGRVLESVVWKAPAAMRRWSTPREIVRYVLSRHHAIETQGHAIFLGDCYDGIVDADPKLAQKAYLSSPVEKGYQMLQSAFSEFSKVLRATDLPLSLSSIMATSSALRGMSTFVPGPLNVNALGGRVPDVAAYLPAHKVVLRFESSGRWPDDLAAIQAMKAAFFERMATSIVDHLPEARTRVVFEESVSDIADRSMLEVIMPTGFAFHASIHHDRERVLLERIIEDKLTETPRRKRIARAAIDAYDRRFDFATKHHTAMNVLAFKFPALAESVRLAKRWGNAQMLAASIPEEAIELLVADSFLSLGEAAPSSAYLGFALFLKKLASWRWQEEALLVPLFTAAQKAEDSKPVYFPADLRTQALDAFERARSADPSMSHRAWFLATEQDIEGRWWGQSHPFAGSADGLQRLAKSSVAILSTQAAFAAVEAKTLFIPPIGHYDFVIHLQPYLLPRFAESVQYDESAWDPSVGSHEYRNMSASKQRASVLGNEPLPGFDPLASFATLLERLYGDNFKIFYDPNGGATIAGLWNPALRAERPFKVALGFSSAPAATDTTSKNIILNRSAILAEIERLGQGLVKRIESKN